MAEAILIIEFVQNPIVIYKRDYKEKEKKIKVKLMKHKRRKWKKENKRKSKKVEK